MNDIPDEIVGWAAVTIVGGLVLLVWGWVVHREYKQRDHELYIPKKWK